MKKVKSDLKLSNQNDNSKMDRGKSKDRLMTKESESSFDKINIIKQKHQNRKD